MREKHIKAVLKKEFNNWLDSIDDPGVKKVATENTIITGGAMVSLMQNEKPNDFDLYFRTKEAVKVIANYYVDKFNEKHGQIETKIGKVTKAVVIDGEDIEISGETVTIKDDKLIKILGKSEFWIGKHDGDFTGMTRMIVNTPEDRIKIYIHSDGVIGDSNIYEDADPELIERTSIQEALETADDISAEKLEEDRPLYFPVFMSTNAITLSGKIQLIVRFYGEPDVIHETYDFVHTKAYWTSWADKVVIPKEVYEAVMNRTLIYTGSQYPLCSVMRIRKFIRKGWNINAGQILKMAFQISELNLKDIDVLEDQLVGVDSLYFMALIEQLRKKQESDPNWNISQNYVVSIIDKIF